MPIREVTLTHDEVRRACVEYAIRHKKLKVSYGCIVVATPTNCDNPDIVMTVSVKKN